MVTGQQIVDAARELAGAPYRTWTWGAPIPMWLYDGMGDPPPASHLLSYGVECIPGDTRVEASDIKGASRRVYRGELVTITTASGKQLSATPNHPVLSGSGRWVPIGELTEGSSVISHLSKRQRLSDALPPDNQGEPAPIQKVCDLLSKSGSLKRVGESPLDFHGDGGDGHVDVVLPDRELQRGGGAGSSKPVSKLKFALAEVGQIFLMSKRLSNPVRFGVGAASHSRVSSAGHPLALLGGGLGVAQLGSVGNTSANTTLLQSPVDDILGDPEGISDATLGLSIKVAADNVINVKGKPYRGGFLQLGSFGAAPNSDAGSVEASAYGAGINSEPSSYGISGLSEEVATDDVIHVERRAFSGHVYNLQTKSGHYVANGIVTHNCSDLVNWALEVNGLPPGYGTEAFYSYLIEYEDFDPYKPQPPGAIAFRPYSGPALADQGHIAIYTGDGNGGMGTQLIQSITAGVTEYYDAATTYGWGGSTSFWYTAKLPNVDYTGGKPTPTPKPKDTVFSVDHLLSVYTSMDRSYAEELFPHMAAAFKEFGINSRERISAFLGQAVGEVGEFTYWEEIDHGGDRFGEYWGRGPMQLTWYENYQRATEYYQAHHSSDVSFVDDPDLVATPKYGFWAGAWFWKYATIDNLNELADAGNFSLIMERCYGAPHPGNEDLRWEYYNWALSHLPDNLTLEGDEPPTPEDDIVFENYNFAVAQEDQEALDYAHLAAAALSTISAYDTLVFVEEENIKALAQAAVDRQATCIVVGRATHDLLPKEAQGQEADTHSYVWQCYEPKADKDAVGSLRRMRNMVLPYFAPGLVERFDSLLLTLDQDKYAPILEEAKKEGPPPPAPPEPLVNWAGFEDDGVLRMGGGNWRKYGYFIWPDPAKNARPYWPEYMPGSQEDR